jgi:7,8-dihydropterin-6-yl-methyl-4-(beta-D-ribofuranosyl)aminobenzene 5'-phosphate synthase
LRRGPGGPRRSAPCARGFPGHKAHRHGAWQPDPLILDDQALVATRAFEPIIGPTCDALGEFSPDFLVPAHCTGWRATHTLAARFPEAFIQNCVGTRFEFTAADA